MKLITVAILSIWLAASVGLMLRAVSYLAFGGNLKIAARYALLALFWPLALCSEQGINQLTKGLR